jgi:iron(III) transport system permease protein
MIAACCLLPIAVICASWALGLGEHWGHIRSVLLERLVLNSVFLVLGVLIGSGILGVSLAWLISHFDFPGKSIFKRGLLLPLAMPAYVIGFSYVGMFTYSGPLSSFLRSYHNGLDPSSWSGGSRLGLVLVLSLSLYPYVYFLSCRAFETMSSRYQDAGRSLGLSSTGVFFKLTLPMAWPWLFGSLCLVAMETLADFGTVSVFSYDAFTTAIYKSWYAMFSPSTAAQLASLLLVPIILIYLIERRVKKRQSFVAMPAGGELSGHRLKRLSGFKAAGAISFCAAICSFGFFIPLCQLIIWALESWPNANPETLISAVYGSLALGLMVAVSVLFISLLLLFTKRLYPSPGLAVANKLSTLGYALPGSILAIGVYIPMAYIDHRVADTILEWTGTDIGLILTSSAFLMVFGLSIRFLAIAHTSVSAAIERISLRIDDAAKNLGVIGFRQFRNIHLPLIRKAAITAGALVFVDTVKEMPLTLMTRPFGWDALSVKVFEYISEGDWQQASLPAMFLVGLGVLAVFGLGDTKS